MRQTLYILLILFLIKSSYSQIINQWSEEKILWQCKEDTSIKLSYRVNIGEGGINSLVEINGPNKLDSMKIIGTLSARIILRDGNISNEKVEQEKITADKPFYSQSFTFDISNLNQISFEGSCISTKKLIFKKIQFEKDTMKKFTPKTKTNAMGKRG